jgi:hypothetical protein
MKTLAVGSGLFLLGLSIVALADRPPPPRHRPPPEAFEACKTLKRGDACSMTLRDHAVTGTCDAPPNVTELACRPDGPPPESLAACKQKSEGDACSFVLGQDTIAGTCSKGPHGEAELGCRPRKDGD